MTSYVRKYQKNRDTKNSHHDINRNTNVRRKADDVRSDSSYYDDITGPRSIDTPPDPSKLSTPDRKRLLLKRISQLEETDKYIDELNNRMSTLSDRKSSRTSYAKSLVSNEYNTAKYVLNTNSNPRPFTVSPIPNSTNDVRHIVVAQRYVSTNSPNRHSPVRQSMTLDVQPRDNYAQSLAETYTVSPKKDRIPSLPENEATKSSYKQYRYISDVPTKGVKNIRKADRQYRKHVITKAEQLLNERKRRERMNDSALNVSARTAQRLALNQPTHPKRSRSRSPMSDTEYVEVPETIDDDVISGFSGVNDRNRQLLLSGVPSAAQ
ncbi:hypothetical protein DPMN_037603, partial [Dreissena polymorpha]